MGGFFGVVSKGDCVADLFYGTDYHSHLGTKIGGLAVKQASHFTRFIHDISNAQFRSKFEVDILKMKGNMGIGVISDYDDQPLIISSHLGVYAIVTVSRINNIEALTKNAYSKRTTHFTEMNMGEINPTELAATLINQGESFEAGIENVQRSIQGSCSLLLLTKNGIYAARDKLGRTPVVIGEKTGGRRDSFAVSFESCAFPNIDYRVIKYLGPGETVLVTEEGVEQKKAAGEKMQICAFLWVYYGYPASHYEGINVEDVRYACGRCLAQNDNTEIDLVAGIPDSGVGHALGYAQERRVPFKRPFVKYTPTWPRSFMPQDQEMRNLVARMKLIPIPELIKNSRLLFCEDSIVRGTQLRDTIRCLYSHGAKEVHMRPACPPLIYGCKFLNFSRSKSEMDLAGRQAIREIEGRNDVCLAEYINEQSDKYRRMVNQIKEKLNLTTLKYQKLPDLIKAIGLPEEKLCTYCWDGREPYV